MTDERTLTGTLRHDLSVPSIEFDTGDRTIIVGGMPPNRVRLPAGNGMMDQWVAYPLVDWPPTVVYRFERQVPETP